MSGFHICVREVIAKPEWVGKLSGFLHDSLIEGVQWAESQQKLTIQIYRVCWEIGARDFLHGFPGHGHPAVLAELVVAPTKGVGDRRSDKLDAGYPEQIMEMELSGTDLKIESSLGAISITLGPEASLEVRDKGVPSRKGSNSCLGYCIHDPRLIKQFVQEIAKSPNV